MDFMLHFEFEKEGPSTGLFWGSSLVEGFEGSLDI